MLWLARMLLLGSTLPGDSVAVNCPPYNRRHMHRIHYPSLPLSQGPGTVIDSPTLQDEKKTSDGIVGGGKSIAHLFFSSAMLEVFPLLCIRFVSKLLRHNVAMMSKALRLQVSEPSHR